MEYRDELGNVFELPAYTLELSNRLTDASKAPNNKVGLLERYDFLTELFPADYLDEVLGSNDIKEMDILELSKLFNSVYAAYMTPMLESQFQALSSTLNEVMPMLDKLERIQANGGGKPNRQGFNRIK